VPARARQAQIVKLLAEVTMVCVASFKRMTLTEGQVPSTWHKADIPT